MINRQQSRATV